MTRRWLLPALIALAAIASAYFGDRWLPPFLVFLGTNADVIEGLTNFVQLLLWLAAPFYLWQRWRTERAADGVPRRSLGETTRRYLRFLVEKHQFLSLLGMGVTDRLPLRLQLLELYVPLTARQRAPEGEAMGGMRLAGRALSKEEAVEVGQRLGEHVPILDLLRKHDGLVVLGDPGAGKSTLLKYLAVALASGRGKMLGRRRTLSVLFSQRRGKTISLKGRLPVLLSLGGYAEALATKDESIGAFFARHYRERGLALDLEDMLSNALEKGRALLLLDGLDEVKDVRTRHLVADRVKDFFALHRGAGNKFVLTSRIVGYRDVALVAEGLGECTLLDFEQEEIEAFVDRWSAVIEKAAHEGGEVAAHEARTQRESLLRALRENPGVRELAANPLLLTILAVMKRQGVTLPARRVELYDNCVKVLLEDWQRARSLSGRSLEHQDRQETLRVLAPVALWMQRSAPGAGLVREGDLRQYLLTLFRERGVEDPEAEAEAFLAVARASNLLVDRGGNQFGFLHLTFQEYLAAVALVQGAQQGLEPLIQETSVHVGDATWREVSRLAVAHLGVVKQLDQQAGQIVDHLLEHRPGPPGEAEILAGLMLSDLGRGGAPVACWGRGVAATLATLTDPRVPAARRAQAGRILSELGDTRKCVTTLDGMEFCWVPPGPFLMGSALDDSLAFGNERPQRELDIPYGYWIARFPITGEQWREYIGASGRAVRDERSLALGSNEPVAFVTWDEILACCRWLTTKWQTVQLLPAGWLVRLPSEPEWEKAARGGSEIPEEILRIAVGSLRRPKPKFPLRPNFDQNRVFPWGASADPERANYNETAIGTASSVGAFPGGTSPYGCEDLSGNRWEWTLGLWGSNYSEHQFSYRDLLAYDLGNPHGCGTLIRIVRGGSYFDQSRFVRCSFRQWNMPSIESGIGFRVTLSPTFPEPPVPLDSPTLWRPKL